MKLYVAGVFHFDPQGRSRLRAWLAGLGASNQRGPGFVAVEHDRHIFEQVRDQRPRLKALVEAACPQASAILLETLEKSLAYEGDTHNEIFPGAPTLWLDEGRKETVIQYAEDRWRLYMEFLGGGPLPSDARMILMALTEGAWLAADRPTRGTERDGKWARLTSDAITTVQGEWAIAIVGANHASDYPGYMVPLLRKQGTRCEVTFLTPKGSLQAWPIQ